MSQILNNKVVVVTGGSRGLGRAMVERFTREGARVVFSYRSNEAAANEVIEAVKQWDGRAHAVQADLGTVDGVTKLFEGVDAALQSATGDTKFDVLVTNAGIMNFGPIEEVTEAAFDQLFDINVKGVFFTIQQASSRLRDGGRIITLGTGLTRFAYPEIVTYSAGKGAIDTLTRVLAKHFGERGITVNTLAPGAIDTDMNPWLKSEEGIARMSGITALNRVGHAEDIADAAVFLASDDSRWVTGQRIEASGGQQL